MPFFGLDWRAPGDKWIRTELGWKRVAEVHANLCMQIAKVATLPSKRDSTRRPRSLDTIPRKRTLSQSNSRRTSPLKEKNAVCVDASEGNAVLKKDFDDKRLQHLQLGLALNIISIAQRCISVRKTSRECSHYSTVSDALNKMNFSEALSDTNCYPFICKVVSTLFVNDYWTLSGTMQTTLLKMVDRAKDIAMETRQHTRLALRLIERAKNTLEKGRNKMMTGFSIARVDSKIKMMISFRAELNEKLNRQQSSLPLEVPSDLWRLVIPYLTDPRDVLNLGNVNIELHSITSEGWVWKNLTQYHYGIKKDQLSTDSDQPTKWMNIFKEKYLSSGQQLPALESQLSHAVTLCKLCHSVYWRSYGHPCHTGMAAHSSEREATNTGPSTVGLTPGQFLHLFHC